MKIAHTNKAVICGGVNVNTGDFIVADRDGIVVIPQEKIDEVLMLANARAAIEKNVLSDLLSGSSVRKVWDNYHVL
jgi:4-hydroxy-4-methyl-2-oxoglutarate aldolase